MARVRPACLRRADTRYRTVPYRTAGEPPLPEWTLVRVPEFEDRPRHTRAAATAMRYWRNLILALLAAVFSFGGSFTCNCDGDDDDEVHGFIDVNP